MVGGCYLVTMVISVVTTVMNLCWHIFLGFSIGTKEQFNHFQSTILLL